MPHYEGLSVESCLLFLNDFPEFWQCIPDTGLERRKLPKQWVVNVAWTVVGDQFGAWVKQKIEERNQKLAVEQ